MALSNFNYESYSEKFLSVDDVIVHLKKLESELHNTNLHNLIHFTRTYRYITEAVYEALKHNQFKDKNRMVQFDITFARYFFDALKGYCRNITIVPAWSLCFEYCQKNNSKNTIFMALGINAHVNNDLAQTLYQCNFGNPYKSDFTKVNQIINKQIARVINDLNDNQLPFSVIQKFPALYFKSLQIVITMWRQKAWNNYILLLKNKKTPKNIENQAEQIANLLLLLS